MKASEKQEAEEAANQVFQVLGELSEPVYHRALAVLAFRRRWRPMHVGWKDAIDQLAHALYAMGVLLPYALHQSWWTAALSGFILGAVREVWQFYNWDLRIPMVGERLKDATFFAVGGAILYFIVA